MPLKEPTKHAKRCWLTPDPPTVHDPQDNPANPIALSSTASVSRNTNSAETSLEPEPADTCYPSQRLHRHRHRKGNHTKNQTLPIPIPDDNHTTYTGPGSPLVPRGLRGRILHLKNETLDTVENSARAVGCHPNQIAKSVVVEPIYPGLHRDGVTTHQKVSSMPTTSEVTEACSGTAPDCVAAAEEEKGPAPPVAFHEKGIPPAFLFVLAGESKINLKKVRTTLSALYGSSKGVPVPPSGFRLVPREKVREVTGYEPGAVTPLGLDRTKVAVYLDVSLRHVVRKIKEEQLDSDWHPHHVEQCPSVSDGTEGKITQEINHIYSSESLPSHPDVPFVSDTRTVTGYASGAVPPQEREKGVPRSFTPERRRASSGKLSNDDGERSLDSPTASGEALDTTAHLSGGVKDIHPRERPPLLFCSAGSHDTAIAFTLEELIEWSNFVEWVDVSNVGH